MSNKKKTWPVILKRELHSYFTSPMAYIVGGIFLVIAGFIFFSTFFVINRAELRQFFQWLPVLFSFFIPALTMRIFSEEKRSGSFETLVTLPVTTKEILVGKFLAVFVSSLVLLVPTLFYVITCCIFGSPDAGPIIGGYAGAILLSAAFCAIGLFSSSITKNQIVSFLTAFIICIALTMLDYFAILIPGNIISVITFLSARSHFASISRGIIDSRDVIYFLSLTALFLALTYVALEKSRKGKTHSDFKKWILGPQSDIVLFAVVLVLLNLVSTKVFFRGDLTAPKSYSLSNSSKQVVKNLDEPLSVKVFFTKNLTAPYDSVQQYISDILMEYDNAGNSYFSYEIFNMDKKNSQKVASEFGVNKTQIQVIKDNQRSSENVYMGVVITYGDQIEVINPVTSTSGFEYELTAKMNEVIYNTNALAGLKNKIQLTLYKSKSLSKIGIQGFNEIDDIVAESVSAVNKKFGNAIEFKVINPAVEDLNVLSAKYGTQLIRWKNPDGSSEAGTLDLVLECGEKSKVISAHIAQSLFGGYMLTGLDNFAESLEENVKALVSRTSTVAYVTGHGELDLEDQQNLSAVNLNPLLNDTYTIQAVNLSQEDIPATVQSVIVNGPKTKFTDEELYKLDQFLMKGGNLILFMDPFNQIQNQTPYGYAQTDYIPSDTGLEEMIEKYGLKLNEEFVMDEKCYTDVDRQYGNLNFYYIPTIQKENMNQKNAVTKNLGFVLFLETGWIDSSEAVANGNIKVTPLVKTTSKAWTLKDNIILSPLLIAPPDADSRSVYDLSVLAEGKFTSAYSSAPAGNNSNSDFASTNHISSSVQNGKIFLCATSAITTQQVLPERNDQPVGMFIRNAVDYCNGNEDLCSMRTKGLSLNALKKQSGALVEFAKYFNEFGLAVLVVIAGLVVLLVRKNHRKNIRMTYNPDDEREAR